MLLNVLFSYIFNAEYVDGLSNQLGELNLEEPFDKHGAKPKKKKKEIVSNVQNNVVELEGDTQTITVDFSLNDNEIISEMMQHAKTLKFTENDHYDINVVRRFLEEEDPLTHLPLDSDIAENVVDVLSFEYPDGFSKEDIQTHRDLMDQLETIEDAEKTCNRVNSATKNKLNKLKR